MCLAVPAKIIELTGSDAVADCIGNRIQTNISLVPYVKLGDYVLVHAGFAITVLDEDEAKKTWKLLEDIDNFNRTNDKISG
jgi:hydrogenase expression/formation protein HypC